MSKGLKQMVAEAIEKEAAPEPVEVSAEARHSLSGYVRQWSGWPTAVVEIGDPRKQGIRSPWAACLHESRKFFVNTDTLVLNPHRVLLTITPFRLRQEAVLTGALLHEAGHARHSLWMPGRGHVEVLRHSDGATPTKQTVALARLMEEPRVEGLMARDADKIGAAGLDWTMRASAAQLVPMTQMAADPNQALMDLITSWALRAGRQIALAHTTGHSLRHWVQDFTTLVHETIKAHLTTAQDNGASIDPHADTTRAMNLLLAMTHVTDDTGPTMIDDARDVLALLFPETPPEDQPEAGEGCSESGDSDESEEQEQQQQSSGSGEGEAGQDEQEQDEQDSEPEAEPESGESGEGKSGEGDDEDSEGGSGEGEQEDQPEREDQPEDQPEDATSSSDDEAEPEDQTDDAESPLAKALREMEERSTDETEEEAEEDEEETSGGAGAGAGQHLADGWRLPTKDERSIQSGAERFLRSLIAPSEMSHRSLDDAPSAMVDGAAMAAWKAGGQHQAPRFFVRTRRNIEPSPPVQIAVLVDWSQSMEQLQKPSAVLSWALASAALDLRNFAGRGQQIESCMIHWGKTVQVTQRNGQTLPGIREYDCNEGTYAMAAALEAVETEMPGFFTETEKPVNRLLVQFTDWELFGRGRVVEPISRALASGVNMLTVAPTTYSERRSDLTSILSQCPIQRGKSTLLRYNPAAPGEVWEVASKSLL